MGNTSTIGGRETKVDKEARGWNSSKFYQLGVWRTENPVEGRQGVRHWITLRACVYPRASVTQEKTETEAGRERDREKRERKVQTETETARDTDRVTDTDMSIILYEFYVCSYTEWLILFDFHLYVYTGIPGIQGCLQFSDERDAHCLKNYRHTHTKRLQTHLARVVGDRCSPCHERGFHREGQGS